MIKKLINLEDRQVRIATLLALQKKQTETDVFREAITIGFQQMLRDQATAGSTLLRIAAKAVKTGDPNLSTNIDTYLYEDA